MITDAEVSEDPENNQTNPWPKCDPIALDRIMLNMWTKWAIDLEDNKSQLNIKLTR